MKFILHVRSVMEDDGDLQMYLEALHKEISTISGVIQAKRDCLTFRIETNDSMLTTELKNRLKPAFLSSLGSYVGFASLEQVAAEIER